MSRLWKNWTVHNLISHPVSELIYLLSFLIIGREKAEAISGWVHDVTVPEEIVGNGRG